MVDSAEKFKKLLLQKLEDGDVEKVAGGKRIEILLSSEEAKKLMEQDVDICTGDEVKLILEQDEDDKKESCVTMKFKINVPKNG